MTTAEHRARHVLLHTMLDELVADWIRHSEKRPSQATVLELMLWSGGQIDNPTTDDADKEKQYVH
jgi:hypothetical protein